MLGEITDIQESLGLQVDERIRDSRRQQLGIGRTSEATSVACVNMQGTGSRVSYGRILQQGANRLRSVDRYEVRTGEGL